MYITMISMFANIWIMFATVRILFMPESTEGVSEGQEARMEKKELVEMQASQ
jgi:hypothetical protein